MPKPRPMISLLVALSLVGAPVSGRGDEPPATAPQPEAPPSDDDVKDHLRKGKEARDAQRWTDAIGAYGAALEAAKRAGWSEERRAPIAVDLASCEAGAGLFVEAADHIHEALRAPRLPAHLRTRYMELLHAIIDQQVVVVISVDPWHARLFLDGAPLPQKLLNYAFMNPGTTHTLRASLEGFLDAEETFVATREQGAHAVTLTLRKKPEPVAAPPPAHAPPRPAAAPATKARTRAAPAQAREDRLGSTLRGTAFVLSAGGALVGAALAVSAAAAQEEAEAHGAALARDGGDGACTRARLRSACGTLHDTLELRDTLAGAAIGAFAGSGALGLLAVSSLWWMPSAPQRTGLRVVPAAGHVGLAIQTVW